MDLEKFAQSGAAAQIAADEAIKRADLVAKGSPREYVLTDAGELHRLFREVRGYLHTCHHKHGTDWEGRKFAIDALDRLI